ncbi:hypothetical protein MMC29_002209 [Sticta canariensis]|nr:hypothetical protein [Sticta canariensis]
MEACRHSLILNTSKQSPCIKVLDFDRKDSTRVCEMSLLEDTKQQVEDDSVYVDLAQQTSRDNLLLYEAESQALALYDQLAELRLEKAVVEAQLETPPVDESPIDAEVERLQAAERDCLEARAAYLLSSSIVDSVIINDPVLNAVHSGDNATPPERLLHPLIDRRDILGMTLTDISARLHSTTQALTIVKAQNIEAMAKNRELTAALVELTHNMAEHRVSAINESKLGPQLEILREDVRTARKQWKLLKSVVAAVIVGSGVDWARNDELRRVVIDAEE